MTGRDLRSTWLHSLLVGFASWAVSLCLAAPNLRDYVGPDAGKPTEHGNRFHDIFTPQVEDPFFRPAEQMPAWAGTMAFRILVPGIAHIFRLGAWGGVAITWLAGALLLGTIHYFASSHGIDRRNSLLFTLAMGCTPCIQGVHIYVGFVDTISWLAAALMMVWTGPLTWCVLTTISLFNDERILVCLPLALAVVLFEHRHSPFTLLQRGLPYLAAIGGAVAVSLTGRFAIKTGWLGNAPLTGSELPMDGGAYPWAMWHVFNVICSYGPLWALLAWAVVRDRRAWIFWLAVLTYTAVAMKTCTFTFDFWRSLGAIFPLFIIALLAVADAQPKALARTLAVIAVCAIARPQMYSANGVKWLRPLPVALTEVVIGKSFLSLLRLR